MEALDQAPKRKWKPDRFAYAASGAGRVNEILLVAEAEQALKLVAQMVTGR